MPSISLNCEGQGVSQRDTDYVKARERQKVPGWLTFDKDNCNNLGLSLQFDIELKSIK